MARRKIGHFASPRRFDPSRKIPVGAHAPRLHNRWCRHRHAKAYNALELQSCIAALLLVMFLSTSEIWGGPRRTQFDCQHKNVLVHDCVRFGEYYVLIFVRIIDAPYNAGAA